MSSYVYMKVLESAPHRYDRGMRWLSGGRIEAIYEAVADCAATPGGRVLDVGCGTGGVALACAARGAHVTGIDVDPEMLDIARARVDAAGELDGRVELRELGAAEIEDAFTPESLDAVVSCLCFSELSPDEQDYALRTALERLRPGGRLVIADEVAPRGVAARWWYRLRRVPLAAVTYALTQTRTRAVDGLATRVAAAGFTDVEERREAGGDFAVVTARRPA